MMRRLTRILVLLAGCWLAAALPLLAQESPGARVALVVGNSDYITLPTLTTATGDAAAVAAELRALGFEVLDGIDLTRADTEAALQRFVGLLDGAEIGVFYFSGHAAQAEGLNYLLPVDVRPDQLADAVIGGVPLERVLQALDRPGLTGLVLVDAARDTGSASQSPRRNTDRGLAPVSPRPGQLVALAAQPGTIAVAGAGAGAHSAFTEALLRNIGARVDVLAMLEMVRDDVASATDRRQEPWVSAPGDPVGSVVGGAVDGTLADLPRLEGLPSLAQPEPYEMPSVAYAYQAEQPAEDEPAGAGDSGAYAYEAESADADDPAVDEPSAVEPPSPAEPAPVTIAQPAMGDVTRYPVMDLPERVLAAEPFALMIWLSRVAVTPEVAVTPGPDSSVDDDGALTMLLPEDGDWAFRVVLNAPGFRIEDGAGPIAEIAMAADGDSTPALYLLTAEPGAHPEGRATIRATLWHGATFLASIQRTVFVGTGADANQVAEAAPASRAGPVTIDPGYRTADLTIRVDYADPAALGPGQVIIASPHFRAPLIVGAIDTPPTVGDWLAFQYQSFIQARISDRARGGQHPGAEPGDTLIRPLLRGFGQELYKRFAPEVFKDALWALVDDPDTPIETIQVYSNNPLLPWELMRPVSADGTRELDFLGVAFEMARWHGAEGPSMFDRPRQELAFDELVAIAPLYADGEQLASVEAEIAGLRKLPGFREVPGRFGAVQSLFAEPPRGIVHFAGHGVVSDAPQPAGPRSYMIRLEDLDLNVMAWRGLGAGPADDGVFYFFNACDVGQANYVANFVDGWAPAVLEAGAAGFIGGLWPVFDDSAAAFAGRFYTEIEHRMETDPASVAAVLRDLRAAYAETGDPTWLSYVYYGDVNLRLTRGATTD